MNVYPWNEERWRTLLTPPDALPHALLLSGSPGLGKLDFALSLAARLLCETPRTQENGLSIACGRCTSCVWMTSESHPDFRWVGIEGEDAEGGNEEGTATPSDENKSGVTEVEGKTKSAKKSTKIGIQQIRDLSDFIYLGSHRHGRRIVVVHPAEAMTLEAANAILKILEEPPASICFILVSHEWRRLLPTIRSRCRQINFAMPPVKQATEWLSSEGFRDAAMLVPLAAGAPLLARDWAQGNFLEVYQKAIEGLTKPSADPVSMAARWMTLINGKDDFDLQQLVESVQKWILDIVQWKMTGTLRYHEKWKEQIQTLASQADLSALFTCHADLLKLRGMVRHPLNAQLFVESLAALYLRALKTNK